MQFLETAFKREHKLISVQISVFACVVTMLLIVGAIVYNKTTIHDRVNAVEQRQSIEGGFHNLQKALE
ncbi:hypothetical protein FACS189487_07740 [Campylobacterota bacterium]|nr:hypothetical protein FACS189487_07740 [Campylobacterota bacterium]